MDSDPNDTFPGIDPACRDLVVCPEYADMPESGNLETAILICCYNTEHLARLFENGCNGSRSSGSASLYTMEIATQIRKVPLKPRLKHESRNVMPCAIYKEKPFEIRS